MYRADEIKTPRHQELRSNLEDAIRELMQYEEDINDEQPKTEMVVKAMVVVEVICVGDQVTRLGFTSTGDMPTWTAQGFAHEVLAWAMQGSRDDEGR